MRQKRLKISDIEPLMEKYKGNIAAISRHHGVSRGTIYNIMARSPKLRIAREDARQSMIDNAESLLYKQMSDGNVTALIFFLKTQGKNRGYVERHQVQDVTWEAQLAEQIRNGKLSLTDARAAWPELGEEFFAKVGADAGNT